MTANEALTREINANIEKARQYASGGYTDLLSALVAETEDLIKGLKGAGAPKLREELTAELAEAAAATGAEGDGEEESGELVQTSDEGAVSGLVIPPDVQALVDEGTEVGLQGVKLGVEMGNVGERVAQIQLSMRLMSTFNDLPDLLVKDRETQLRAALIFKQVEAQIKPEEVEKGDALKSLKKAVRNKNTDVLVGWLRALDGNKEAGLKEAERLFPDAAAAYLKAKGEETEESPASLTEAVYALYESKGIELPRKGRTELERERKQQAKALASGDDSKLTPNQRLTNYVTAITANVEKAEKNAERLTLSGPQKRKAKNDLQKLIDRLTAIKEGI
ncbi:hypothetical protein [Streptomyces sp. NPDC001546]|uniref:hypothetical protein n=1 Tax=Streptomyces sp. NPDC001546 TaxID=3364585 RepID=UPI003679EBD8